MINYYTNYCIKLLLVSCSFIIIECCCYRLKIWLSFKMGQDRLCGLDLLSIYHAIEISVDNVIKRFASMKKK